MKAEHRKELQTNTLADNLGRLISGGRRMSRRTFLIILGVVVVGLGLLFWRSIRTANEIATAERYVFLDQGNYHEIQEVMATAPDSNAGKAATFQIAWLLLWNEGIRPLTSHPREALMALDSAQSRYARLISEVENDPVLASEANYALALIAETMLVAEFNAAERAKRLTEVEQAYREVAEKFDKTAHGTQAAKRAEYLKTNRAEVLAFYDQFAAANPGLSIMRQLQKQGNLPPGFGAPPK